jgi:hypothetical protein
MRKKEKLIALSLSLSLSLSDIIARWTKFEGATTKATKTRSEPK